MSRVISGLLLFIVMATSAPARAAQPDRFDVYVFGLKIGQLLVTTDISASAYAASARFATSGLAAAFKEVRLKMQTTGTVHAGVFRPATYTEEVNTGKRQSRALIEYTDGVPVLVHGEIDAEDHVPVDPSERKGTIDPLTAMVLAILDRPRDDLCKLDRAIYDGGRKTRVVLNGRHEDAGKVTCTGQFRRVAGYTAKRLKKDGAVPLSLTYAPSGDLMRVREIRLKTSRGPVTVVRR